MCPCRGFDHYTSPTFSDGIFRMKYIFRFKVKQKLKSWKRRQTFRLIIHRDDGGIENAEWRAGGGVSPPWLHKLSMASCADHHFRIHSSWRNRISSHGAGPRPQLDPKKHHLFYTTKEKEIEGGGGRRTVSRAAVKERLSSWGFVAEEQRRKPQKDYEQGASVFQFNFSFSRKPLYRLVDPLSLSQSFLPLSTMQNPSLTSSQITPLLPDCSSSWINPQRAVMPRLKHLASYLHGGATLF